MNPNCLLKRRGYEAAEGGTACEEIDQAHLGVRFSRLFLQLICFSCWCFGSFVRSKKWPGKRPQEMAAPMGKKICTCDDFFRKVDTYDKNAKQAAMPSIVKRLQISNWDGTKILLLMAAILHQLRQVVYPIIYIPGG